GYSYHRNLHSFPTRRSSDLAMAVIPQPGTNYIDIANSFYERFEQLKNEVPSDIKMEVAMDNTLFIKRSVLEVGETIVIALILVRSEEHTSELQSRENLVCRL